MTTLGTTMGTTTGAPQGTTPSDGSGCPVSGGLSPLSTRYDPFGASHTYENFALARKEDPVFFSPEINFWVITRREDILKIFRDPDRFSAQIALTPVTPFAPEALQILKDGNFGPQPVQSNCDRPDHTRIRAIASKSLNIKNFRSQEDHIRTLIRKAMDQFDPSTPVDLVAEMVYELPALVLFKIMGIPEKDVQMVKQWADNRLLMTFGRLNAQEQVECAKDMVLYWNYCKDLVQQKITNPGDDYPSTLLAERNGDDNIISINEINSLMFGLLLAGHETTTNLSANSLRSLLTYRENWEKICADPSLIPNAVEESLRFSSSVICWRRYTLEDVEIRGHKIPKGSNLLLALASANYDEDTFEEPEKFDITRANARDHISFGNGIHFCIGAPLARLELKILLEEITQRFPNMALTSDQDFDIIRTIAFRGPKEVWVNLNAS